MTTADPLHLDMREFLATGTLGPVRLGATMTELRDRLPAAVDEFAEPSGFAAWAYGALELHFFDDSLFRVWCDCLPALLSATSKAGQLTIDPWIVCDDRPRTLAEMLPEFARYGWGIQLSTRGENRSSVTVKILNSGVDLLFEAPESGEVDGASAWPTYELVAFGLGSD
ncbi:hypothetical protein [Streptomyces sp. BE147]|uniref:hypothetical protein n=1 Tax=unclassified Streptomyces TaxID=2593676 RepID=UPI002E77CCA7|nr:hypothetical protein [Streptomyces sp. BE147]MEE1735755.1 hypothetical protein [Streptomyces sp. BE147]